jgi:hypothetical protein
MIGFQKNFQEHRRLSEQIFGVQGCYWKAGTISPKKIAGKMFIITVVVIS